MYMGVRRSDSQVDCFEERIYCFTSSHRNPEILNLCIERYLFMKLEYINLKSSFRAPLHCVEVCISIFPIQCF